MNADFPTAQESRVMKNSRAYSSCITITLLLISTVQTLRKRQQIFTLNFEYGMRVICDMQETAKRMQEIENEQRSLRLRLDRLKDEADELAML